MLETPGGLILELSHYKTTLGYAQDFGSPGFSFEDQGVALHYRVSVIRDRFGNEIRPQYHPNSLKLTTVTAHKSDNSLVQTLTYHYDVDNRLTAIEVPKYGGGTQRFEFYYPDDPTDQASAGRSAFLDDAYAQGTVANSSLSLSPLTSTAVPVAMETLPTDPSGYAMGIDLDGLLRQIPSLHTALDLDHLRDPTSPTPFASFLLRVFHASDGYSFYRIRYNLQRVPGGKDFGRHAVTYRYQLPEAQKVAGYPDRVEMTHLAGTPPSGPASLDVFPMVKRGDGVGWSGASSVLTLAGVNWNFNTSTGNVGLQVPGVPGGTGYLLRDENLSRIQEIRLPVSDTAPFGQQRIQFRYDDNSLNHAEIKTIFHYHSTISQGPVAEVHYQYERIRVWASEADQDAVGKAFNTADVLGCVVFPGQVTCRDPNQDWPRIPTVHEQERDILRKKTVRGLRHASDSTLEPIPDLVTYYAGSPFWTLGAWTVPESFRPGEPNPDCLQVQWGMDGKPFQWTLAIAADGSATVHDGDPTGLDMETVMANYARRRQIFKTYDFDTRFLADLTTSYPELFPTNPSNPWDFQRFFVHAPKYPYLNGGVMTSIPGCEQYDMSPLTLANLFNLNQSRCTSAQITGYELVPDHGYGFADAFVWDALAYGRHACDTQEGNDNCDTTPPHVQPTAVKAIQAPHNAGSWDDTNVTAIAKQLLNGGYSETYTIGAAGFPTPESIAWTKRRYQNTHYSDYYRRYQSMIRSMTLQPHFQLSAENLDGFTWNGTDNTIHLLPEHVQTTQRMSNGGFLMTLSALPNHGATTLSHGSVNPTNLAAGDVFFFGNQIYTITSVVAGNAGFQPAFDINDASDPPHLRFYRYSHPQPGHLASGNGYQPQYDANHPYLGYDALGNNGYGESYAGPMLFHTGSGRHLLPDFGAATPDQVSWNDSTDAGNNDLNGWRYFGRTTRTLTAHGLPFHDYSGINGLVAGHPQAAGDVLTGFATTTTHDGTFHWLPAETRTWYRPITLMSWQQTQAQLRNGFDAALVNDGQDQISQWTYETSPNSRVRGRVRTEQSYRADDPGDFRLTQLAYDNHGRVATEDRVHLKDGVAPYGLRTQFTQRDTNTGLPQQVLEVATQPTVAGGIITSLGTILNQNRSYTEYDNLGRVTRTYTKNYQDPAVPGTDTHLLGAVQHTYYTSALQGETLATRGLDPASEQLSRTLAYSDGLGRSTLSFVQRGIGHQFQVTGTTYDEVGRLDKTYPVRQVPTVTFGTDFFDEWDAWTQAAYNSRGESSGQVTFQNGTAITSSWTHRARIPDTGHGVVFEFMPDRDTNGAERINLKMSEQDRFGQLAVVFDFQITNGAQLFTTQIAAESFIQGLLVSQTNTGQSTSMPGYYLNLLSSLTKVEYDYDRFGNIIKATNGLGGEQVRNFQFDQANRLRYESHPEMTATVQYADFDALDNPQTAAYGSGMPGFRQTDRTFDAYGQLLTATHRDPTSPSEMEVERWSYTNHLDRFPGQVAEALVKRAADSASPGPGVGYRYTYHSISGQIETKTMLHNLDPAMTVGRTNATDLWTATTAQWNQALELTYQYQADSLVRLETLTYPSHPGGTWGSQTKLRYHYGAPYAGLVTKISDDILGSDVLDGITYGAGDQLDRVEMVLGDRPYLTTTLTRDPLNRLESQAFHHGTATPNHRQVAYDRAQRIRQITVDGRADLVYRYDALGQIATATVAAQGINHQFAYAYDSFGNLTQRTENGTTETDISNDANNRANGFGYDDTYGELTSRSHQGTSYAATYSPRGRINRFDLNGGSNIEDYIYDPYGMRVLVSHTDNGQTDHRLYFYDAGNRALVEWEAPHGESPRWDRTTIPFNGSTAVTYDHVGEAAMAPPPSGPPTLTFTNDQKLNDLQFQWTAAPEPTLYALQLADDYRITRHHFNNLPQPNMTPPIKTRFGRYHVRVRELDQPWGPWQTVVYLDPATADDLGRYLFEVNGEDSSHYQNHGDLGSTGLGEGLHGAGMNLTGNGGLTLPDPFALVTPATQKTISLWIKPPPLAGKSDNQVRSLVANGNFQLQIQRDGNPVLFQSPPPFSSKVAVNGQWNHVAVVFHTTQATIYINGSSLRTEIGSTDLTGENLLFGHHGSLPDFQGAMDEIEIFNRGLSAAEILTLYQAGVTP